MPTTSERDGQRPEAAIGVPPEHQDDEDQHEGAEDLGDGVPAVVADGRAGGEDAELLARILFGVEVLLERQPGEDRADERADQFAPRSRPATGRR